MESLQSTFKHKLSHNYFKQGPAGGTEKGGRPGENYFMNKNYIVIKIPKVPLTSLLAQYYATFCPLQIVLHCRHESTV